MPDFLTKPQVERSGLLRPLPLRLPLYRFGFALLISLVALGLTLLLLRGNIHPLYYPFLGAVVIATWFGGPRPGLAAFALNLVLAWGFVFLPEDSSESFWSVLYLGFALTALLLYLLTAALYRKSESLESAYLHFGGVVQISDDAIITVDEQQNITLFNSGAEKIFGYSRDEALGRPLELLIPERYRTMHDHHVRDFGQAGDQLRPMNARGTLCGRRADGSEFPIEASISKFEAGGRKIMTVRLRDVSERSAHEQRLRQMAAIVDSSQDAIVGESLEGAITSWNPAAERLFGYSSLEAIGLNARILLPPGADDEVTINIETVRKGLSETKETVRMRRDGQPLDVSLTISPILDKGGAVIGLATMFRDIADRKRLEAQLLHSQKMEAVGRLAGGVAHDFNNLLSIIVGYAYLIQTSSPEGAPIRSAAEQIMAASDRATSLTRQLLAFSRKQVMRPEVLDLNRVLSGISKILPRLVGEDIDVRFVNGDGLHNIKADPSQVEQVVMNLVVNARDAMPRGGKLTIETANLSFSEREAQHHGVRSGDYVMMAVSDTGHGMDEATRSRIFEPFFTTKEAGKGTGLGLATVYGIVNQSNGHIWVYSEPGQGTTFKIYFPATAGAAAQPYQPAALEPSLCGNETLLLVEDEAQLRELLAHVLRDQGYRVLAAAHGPEALRLLQEAPTALDLLLTDVIMPEMRGQELAEKLLQTSPGMAVIYMSGYTDNALIHSGALPGAAPDNFLQKPFTPDRVLRLVREVLDRRTALRKTRRAV